MERQRRHMSFDGVPDYDLTMRDLDLTQFIDSYQAATGRILNNEGLINLGLIIEERNTFHPTHAAILLSDSQIRQQRLLGFFEQNTPISFEQLKQHFPKISKRTLQADLTSLKNEGLIRIEGQGRGARWVL